MNRPEEKECNESIVFECELDASAETVWRAVTVPELTAFWLGASGDGTASPHYEVLDATPFSRIRYSWRDDCSDRRDTVVTIELWPREAGGTLFRLTHSARTGPPTAAANCNGAPMTRAA